MKRLTVLLISLFAIIFSGCDLDTTDQFKVDKKEILTSHEWFDADKYGEIYTVSSFTDNLVVQKFYEDQSFSSVSYVKRYAIDYNNDKIILTDEYGKHLCEYNSCENDNWMAITCEDVPYIKGWSKKSEALSSITLN